MPKIKAKIIELIWVKITIFFLGNLSTITPPKSEKKNDGTLAKAATKPTISAEWESCKTSHPWATT
jgi:hypothetical protein